MGRPLAILLLFWVICATQVTHAWDYDSLSVDVKKQLTGGDAVILTCRPDDQGTPDRRFVTAALLIVGTRTSIWEVIHDKENAEEFVGGVIESRVISEKENELVVEQRTKAAGSKSYLYTLRHQLTPMKRADFALVNGELRNVLGSWWIFEGPDVDWYLVVYSLHVDPGFFVPQAVVRSGMKKSMPGTLQSMEREVKRRNVELMQSGLP
tara:strand:- start:685 stop:1311 length:627 start_codon:yes stop_codon:yes gene_type:complete